MSTTNTKHDATAHWAVSSAADLLANAPRCKCRECAQGVRTAIASLSHVEKVHAGTTNHATTPDLIAAAVSRLVALARLYHCDVLQAKRLYGPGCILSDTYLGASRSRDAYLHAAREVRIIGG